jgi:hypothetical protein
MRFWKYGIIILCVSMLVLSSGVVSAQTISDDQNDVIKSQSGSSTFQTKQTKPDVDVKQITCTVAGETLTLELEIYGNIQQISPYMYYAAVNTTDYQYIIIMGDGQPSTFVTGPAGSDHISDNPKLVVGEHTISAVFKTHGNATIVEIFGYAKFSNIYISPDMYQDWAPDSRGPKGSFDTGGTDDAGKTTSKPSTPGFEAIVAITAIGVAFILLKRRK